MSHFLYFRSEGGAGLSVRFAGDLLLGSAPDCGLVVPHGTVAPRHARITGTADRLVLASLGPPTSVRRAGAVFVVRAGIPFPLMAGDVLVVGEAKLQLVPEPEVEAPRGGATRTVNRRDVGQPAEEPEPSAPRRPRGVTRVVDARALPIRGTESAPVELVRGASRPDGSRPEGPRPPVPRPEVPRPEVPRPEGARSEAPRPEPAPARGPVARAPERRSVIPDAVPAPAPRRASLALRSQPAVARADDGRADPLEDGPTGFFSRAATRLPTEVPGRTEESGPDRAEAHRPPVFDARERQALELEVSQLEEALERGGGAREQRRRTEQRAALTAALEAQRRTEQETERALAAVRVELAGHEHDLATHERRCREIESQLVKLRARREAAESRRDESVRRLREAEQARDTTWQAVWTLEHDQLVLEGLIDNLELALGLAPKRG